MSLYFKTSENDKAEAFWVFLDKKESKEEFSRMMEKKSEGAAAAAVLGGVDDVISDRYVISGL